MRSPGKAILKANSSVWEVETIMNILQAEDCVVLTLPRDTTRQLFADLAVVRSIATLSRRCRFVTIHDRGHNWESDATRTRFLRTLDGVCALIHCGDGRAGKQIEDASRAVAPTSLIDEVTTRILRTAKLEDGDAGPSRTYIAIDPDCSVPIELDTLSSDGLAAFHNQLASTLRQFGQVNPNLITVHAEETLYQAVYEIFQNTYEHARFGTDSSELRGMRFLRFHTYIENRAGELSARSRDFVPLKRFFDRRTIARKSKRYLEISIGDEGMGIVAHYLQSTNHSVHTDPAVLINQLLFESLSSKRIAGAGLGLPNALSALSSLKAFVTLRSGSHWMYRDFSDPERVDSTVRFEQVHTSEPPAITVGTQFTILLDFAL